MILREALAAAARRLAGAGIDGAAGDARALIADATGLKPMRISLQPDFEVTPGMQARLDSHIARRIAREPVSKILGVREFWGRDFRVTRDVLDPRPETESLIAAALEGGPARMLADLGTGSGIIAVTLLCEWPSAHGFATDMSAPALAVAADNAATHGVAGRLQFEAIKAGGEWYGNLPSDLDLIVSNPPYITGDEMAELSPEVSQYDPHLALTPGGDGLDPYRAIAAGALAHLALKGRVMVEIGWQQGPQVAAIFAAAGLKGIAVLPDMDGRDRVVSASRPG